MGDGVYFKWAPPRQEPRPRRSAVSGLPVTLVIVGVVSQVERDRLTMLEIEHEIHAGLDRAQSRSISARAYSGVRKHVRRVRPAHHWAQAIGRPVVTSNVCAILRPLAAQHAGDPFDIAVSAVVSACAGQSRLFPGSGARGFENAQAYAPELVAKSTRRFIAAFMHSRTHVMTSKDSSNHRGHWPRRRLLAQLLLDKGYRVVGTYRRTSSVISGASKSWE